jgi:hypothetical protein
MAGFFVIITEIQFGPPYKAPSCLIGRDNNLIVALMLPACFDGGSELTHYLLQSKAFVDKVSVLPACLAHRKWGAKIDERRTITTA